MAPSVIEPANFRLVAHCLNQLCYGVPTVCRYIKELIFSDTIHSPMVKHSNKVICSTLKIIQHTKGISLINPHTILGQYLIKTQKCVCILHIVEGVRQANIA